MITSQIVTAPGISHFSRPTRLPWLMSSRSTAPVTVLFLHRLSKSQFWKKGDVWSRVADQHSFHQYIFISLQRYKVINKSWNSRNQGFSNFFAWWWIRIRTNKDGSGRPKNVRIERIRIKKNCKKTATLTLMPRFSTSCYILTRSGNRSGSVKKLQICNTSVVYPWHFGTDTDPYHRVTDPDPALFVSGFQNNKKISFFLVIFSYYFLKKHSHQPSNIKSCKDVIKQKKSSFFLIFLPDDGRIRIRTNNDECGRPQKLTDQTDPDKKM